MLLVVVVVIISKEETRSIALRDECARPDLQYGDLACHGDVAEEVGGPGLSFGDGVGATREGETEEGGGEDDFVAVC